MIAALAVFSAIAALICARAFAAGPALFFGAVAVVLFVATPLGAGLPDAVAAIASAIGNVAETLTAPTA